ncbi:MAG: hypothetical protein COY80_00145 [Candidatus Pacebacteria bacterium CG_4_10_14_0_8_um_filter_42_14]|nr:MAG: hypothetical protein COY80_00145 [Candidatus Pacebacteria bacterium CG_4_10_14_0_8_um_filter_42_14]
MLTKSHFTSDGINAVYHCTNNQFTRAIIFVGGIGSGARAWEEVIEQILEKLPDTLCVSFDLRCHGASECSLPKDGIDLVRVLSNDLLLVSSHLDQNLSLTLVGHSLGGSIIQEAVALHPTLRNAKKILICSSIKTQLSFVAKPSRLYGIVRWLTKNKKPGFEVSTESFLRFKNTGDFYLPRILTEIFRLTPPVFFAFWLGCFSYKNTQTELIDNKRTLILYGKYDHILPKGYQEKTFRELRKTKTVAINSNHIAPLNAVDKLSEQIIQFLKIP